MSDAIEGVDPALLEYVGLYQEVWQIAAELGYASAADMVRAEIIDRSRGVHRYGAVVVNVVEHRVTINGRWVAGLTPTEFGILRVLASARKIVSTPSQIIEGARLHSHREVAPATATKTHITRLRAKLKAQGFDQVIETVPGAGYRMRWIEPEGRLDNGRSGSSPHSVAAADMAAARVVDASRRAGGVHTA